MALLDFLKNKKEKDNANEKKAKKVSAAPKGKKTKKAVAAPVVKKADVVPKVPVQEGSFSYDVVKEPHISEKATILAEKNKYVFKVGSGVNKHSIKKSVEGIYKVDVLAVNIIKTPKKKRRIGRIEGYKKAYSKAVVTIKEGQKIEIY